MQTIQNTVIGALETVKSKLEEADSSVVHRQKVFAAAESASEEPTHPQDNQRD